jgi:tetratricopeptide (TPR) repeat protein
LPATVATEPPAPAVRTPPRPPTPPAETQAIPPAETQAAPPEAQATSPAETQATSLAEAQAAALAEARAASLAEAHDVFDLVASNPRRALELAEELLARHGVDAETRVVAERAAALSELDLGRTEAARRRLERARDRARADGPLSRVPEIQVGLAIALLQSEEPEAAMAEIEAAMELAADEATLGRAQSQRATILMRLGRYPEALEQATVALVTCRSAGLLGPVARLLSNQGIVHAYLGQYATAGAELAEALQLLRDEGSDLGAANAVHNLGFVAARQGDVPAALAYFDAAFAEYVRLDVPAHAAFVDRCEVLLAARLLPEARAAAEAAVAGLARAGRGADLAEARLMLAEVALASGDLETAGTQGSRAALALTRQNRTGWAALARFVAARARWAARGPDIDEAARLALELETAGWSAHGLEARIVAARASIEDDDREAAISVLAAARPAETALASTSSDERVRAFYAVALGSLAGGERSAALQALRAGLQIAEEHRAAFGATELRARAATRSAELAELGLDLALESGDPAEVFEWCERWRARSLWPPDATPPTDPVLAERLAQLRHTVAALELAVQVAEPVAELAARRHEIESDIRTRSLEVSHRQRRSPVIPTLVELQASLARANVGVLVELFAVRGHLHAVVCTQRECVVRPLAPVPEVERWRAATRFGLGRLALGRGSGESLVAAGELLVRATAEIDRLVLGPLGDILRGGTTPTESDIVLVPTGGLHSLPWGMLPSLRGRPVSVVPSAALFTSRRGVRRERGATLLVAAPGVPSAEQEVEALGRLYQRAIILRGSSATAGNVAAAMAGAGTAHIVAHGRFRMDNALFSAVELADGPLTVYDLEQISPAPELLVLSACDAGRSDVQPGDELMGTAAAMLSLGSQAIVASVVPVPDAGATRVMTELHQFLIEGHSPSAALALTQSQHSLAAFGPGEVSRRQDEVLVGLAAAGFVCFGMGGWCQGGTIEDVGGEARVRVEQVAAKITK